MFGSDYYIILRIFDYSKRRQRDQPIDYSKPPPYFKYLKNLLKYKNLGKNKVALTSSTYLSHRCMCNFTGYCNVKKIIIKKNLFSYFD